AAPVAVLVAAATAAEAEAPAGRDADGRQGNNGAAAEGVGWADGGARLGRFAEAADDRGDPVGRIRNSVARVAHLGVVRHRRAPGADAPVLGPRANACFIHHFYAFAFRRREFRSMRCPREAYKPPFVSFLAITPRPAGR